MGSFNPIGIMQGRLLPKYQGRYQAHPVGYWQEEFPKAAELGLDCIEFILDFNDAELNPLSRDDGPDEILLLSQKTGVKVASVCADYFMEAPLHHVDEQVAAQSQRVLQRLLSNGKKLGLTDIVMPCVDQSRLINNAAIERFIARLRPLVEATEIAGINLSLETDLAPQPFAELLERFDSPRVTVNYDTGNSATLGYDSVEELACYGDKITDIHIKDRKLGGGSVPLGTGDAQFGRFFKALRPLKYTGPFIMQSYRDDEGLAIFKQQLAWVHEQFVEYMREAVV
ncbi:MAG: sugar phosphate isomerase/epimerase family protein [Methylococcaceae bacterium]